MIFSVILPINIKCFSDVCLSAGSISLYNACGTINSKPNDPVQYTDQETSLFYIAALLS